MLMDVVYNTVMITGSPSLRVLDVGWNEIEDIGVELLLPNSNNLTELVIQDCGLSVEGTSYTCCYSMIVVLVHNQMIDLLN